MSCDKGTEEGGEGGNSILLLPPYFWVLLRLDAQQVLRIRITHQYLPWRTLVERPLEPMSMIRSRTHSRRELKARAPQYFFQS